MADRFPTRRRAEHFARLVEGEESARDQVLAPLVDVTTALRDAEPVRPRSQFRDTLRAHLMEAAAVELEPRPAEPPAPAHRGPRPADERHRRKLVALAGSLVLLGGMSGVAAASQQALPGDTLYPVKRGIEQVEYGMAGNERSEGRELLEQAENRLNEVHSLAARGESDARVRQDITQTLQQFSTNAGRGGNLLIEAYEQAGTDADLMRLRTFTSSSADRLSDLSDDVPAETEPALREAVNVVESLDALAMRACPDCTSELPAVDVDIDLLSLQQQAGDRDPGANAAGSPNSSDGQGKGRAPEGGAKRNDSGGAATDNDSHEAEASNESTPDVGDGLPLPDVPDDALGGDGSEGSPSEQPSGGLLDSDGPVRGDEGALGTKGPVLGDDGLAGTNGPLLGDKSLLGQDGPVRGERGLVGEQGLLGGQGN